MWQRKCCAKENFRTNENSSLTSTILQNKVPPVFWLVAKKVLQAYEVNQDIGGSHIRVKHLVSSWHTLE